MFNVDVFFSAFKLSFWSTESSKQSTELQSETKTNVYSQ